MAKLMIRKLLSFLVFFNLVFASAHMHAAQKDIDTELNQIINAVKTGVGQKAVLKSSKWLGYSDARLFDLIEKALLNSYLEVNEHHDVDLAAWQARALGFSGREKYQKTLTLVAEKAINKKLRKHALKASAELTDFSRWNPVISRGLVNAPSGKLNQQRVMNMLESNMPDLVAIGAKRIYHKYYLDRALTDKANSILLAAYANASDDQVDGLAWICKALSKSGLKEYKTTLETVANEASNRKLAKYANKYK